MWYCSLTRTNVQRMWKSERIFNTTTKMMTAPYQSYSKVLSLSLAAKWFWMKIKIKVFNKGPTFHFCSSFRGQSEFSSFTLKILQNVGLKKLKYKVLTIFILWVKNKIRQNIHIKMQVHHLILMKFTLLQQWTLSWNILTRQADQISKVLLTSI